MYQTYKHCQFVPPIVQRKSFRALFSNIKKAKHFSTTKKVKKVLSCSNPLKHTIHSAGQLIFLYFSFECATLSTCAAATATLPSSFSSSSLDVRTTSESSTEKIGYKISDAIFAKFCYRPYPQNGSQTEGNFLTRQLRPIRSQKVPLRNAKLLRTVQRKNLSTNQIANKSKWRLFDEANNTHSSFEPVHFCCTVLCCTALL